MFKSYLVSEARKDYHNKLQGPAADVCDFCEYYKANEHIFSTKLSFGVVNIYPYNTGHILVLPIRHVKDIRELNEDELKDLVSCGIKLLDIIEKVYGMHAFNLGMNIGQGSGGSMEHLHLHIVPRSVGDVGFLETTTNTKVLKESLEDTRKRLKAAIEESGFG